jgi:hypothetical protein
MTKALVKSMFLAGLLVLWAAGCDDNGNGHEDADADVTPDPTPDPTQEDTVPDTTPDPTDEDVVEDVPEDTPVDTPEEEMPACPDDDPPDHIYIDVNGAVTSLDGTTEVAGSWTAGISPLDALTNPTPTPIATSAVGTDGVFSMECIDVGPVTIGLVILHDDDPSGSDDNFYPTGTGVKAWADATEKVDVTGAAVFGISQTLAAVIETMASVDIDTNGLAMGIIADGTTGTPIEGATIVRSGGTAINVIYPNAAFDGVGASTASTGVFIVTDTLSTMVNDLSAEATGYTFGNHSAATKGGFIYFLLVAGTPE